MTDSEDTPLDPLLEAAPVGVLILDEDRRIRRANRMARQMLGCSVGACLESLVREEHHDRIDELLGMQGESRSLQLELAGSHKTVEAVATGEGPGQALFFTDISEKVALGRQLRNNRQPSRKRLFELHSTTTSISSYAELVDVMLDEEPAISGDRLNVIRRYHKEVTRGLEILNRLLKVERAGGRRPDAAAIPLNRKQIVIIDDEPAIGEFIEELMKGLKHRVSRFDAVEPARQWCHDNRESIDLVIIDHNLRTSEDRTLVDELLSMPAEFPLVVCTEEERDELDSARAYLCRKPIDISDLMQIVSDLI